MNQPPIILPTKGDIVAMARYGYIQYAVYLRRSKHRIYFLARNPYDQPKIPADIQYFVSWIQKSPHYTIDQRFLVVNIDQVVDPEVKQRLLKIQEVVENEF